MGSATRASLIVAASVGAVEALKDQAGLCRWNYATRSLCQSARSSMGSFTQATRMASSPSRTDVDDKFTRRKAEKAENVMHLICWGPK